MSNLMQVSPVAVSGVRAYVDANGTAQLNLEDVARGLGFTQDKNDVEYIRWETIIKYLQGFGFSQRVGKDTFIPENIFYRLAMKAKNDAAERFQAKVLAQYGITVPAALRAVGSRKQR